VLEELGSQVAAGIQGLSGKIDDFLTDEKLIREKVLNGHEPMHGRHHDWVKEQIEKERERDKVCAWAKVKMDEERVAQSNAKTRVQKFLDKLAEQVAVFIIGGLSVALGLSVYLK
jgi:hypothetical protein